ncbi:MAG TPA: DUF6766 family protein [Chthoniobacterales bacterium]|nr:DUF6766 family protein [Chthoniobacterales bacterium]
MKRLLRENGLSLVLFGLFFAAFILGQVIFGWKDYNSDREEHRQPVVSLSQYLGSGHFLEATMENWESEFLQMGVYVILTAVLYQKGSAESKSLSGSEPVDRDPRRFKNKKQAPWPVRRGGWVLAIYEHSLALAFTLLFLISLFLHAAGGKSVYNEEQILHGQPPVSLFGYMATSRFWFESFQNWQSEFLAIGSMVVLTIFLRQRGSPESKPVDSPHWQTGSE